MPKSRSPAKPRCPECRDPLPPDVSFCLRCGFDQETGENQFAMAPLAPLQSKTNSSPSVEVSKPNVSKTTTTTPSAPYEQIFEDELREMELREEDSRETLSTQIMFFIVAGLLGVLLISYFFQKGLAGKSFLYFYVSVFSMCLIAREYLRTHYRPAQLISVFAIFFLALGGLRLYYGMHQNMHRFQYLYLMMAIGTIMICLGASTIPGEDGNSSIVKRMLITSAIAAMFIVVVAYSLWTLLIIFAVFALVIGRTSGSWGSAFGGCSGCSSCGSSCGGCGGGGCGGCGG